MTESVRPDSPAEGMKALVVNVNNNQIETCDAESLVWALRNAGAEVERIPLILLDKMADTIDFGSYDFIAVWPAYTSSISGATRRTTMERLVKESKPGAVHLMVCDVRIGFSPYLWNKGETPSEHRTNAFTMAPITVVGSFSKSFYDDPMAMKRATDIWMKKIHPESEFLALEWNLFHAERTADELDQILDEQPAYTESKIARFYYGLEKLKVARSLQEMGFGSQPDDAVIGPIEKSLPEVRSLSVETTGPVRRVKGPEVWLPMAKSAERLMLPYDPVKGDHQVTKRFLEYAVIGNPVEVSPKVNPGFMKFLHRDVWDEESEKTAKELIDHIEKKVEKK